MTETHCGDRYQLTWADAGKSVEVEIDGKIHKGYLQIDEVYDGEDEVAIFSVVGDNEQTIPFALDGKWRFADGGEQ